MQRKDFIYSISELNSYLLKKGYDMEKVELPTSEHSFKLLIPKYYVDLIDWYNLQDPLRKMVVTSSREDKVYGYELQDPIADKPYSPVPGIIHRHKDRCLLMLTNACAVHCRFCFRKNLLNTNSAHYEESMKYIETHKELWEVIFSGGDPFTLTDHLLEKTLKRLRNVQHIKTIRFHTRTPVVYPQRVTNQLSHIIRSFQPITVVIHINHPAEVTAEFMRSVRQLKEAGVLLLSQTVLMKDINNNVEILASLFKKMVENSIKPYYVHHLDLAAGTHHFRISIEEGKRLMNELCKKVSGLCIPKYVIDLTGGYGKVPVDRFKHVKGNEYKVTLVEGKEVYYKDPYYQE